MPCERADGHDLEHVLNDQGREALAWLVEQKQFRIEQKGACDRKHLLLAAGKLPALVALALGQPRE